MFLVKICVVIAVIGSVYSVDKENSTKSEQERTKRGFVTLPFHRTLFSPYIRNVVRHEAANNAARLSKAAQLAQALMFDESALAAKSSVAVQTAANTYSMAASTVRKLAFVLSKLEAVMAQAYKTLEVSKKVEASQHSMVFKAQHALDTLGKHQILSLRDLQLIKSAAFHPKALDISGEYTLPSHENDFDEKDQIDHGYDEDMEAM